MSDDSPTAAEARVAVAPPPAPTGGEPRRDENAREPSLADVMSAIEEQTRRATSEWQALREELAALRQRLGELADSRNVEELTPSAARPTPIYVDNDSANDSDGDWERVVFGHDLARDGGLAFDRRELIGGLVSGDETALALVGQILVFRAAGAERMPVLLKDLGEAYYRWRPQAAGGDDALQEALIDWLQQRCEAAGAPNTIELVRPGDRYESARHNAKERGVEVTEVFGWVVLRDNGKIYTKANVAVK